MFGCKWIPREKWIFEMAKWKLDVEMGFWTNLDVWFCLDIELVYWIMDYVWIFWTELDFEWEVGFWFEMDCKWIEMDF